MTTTETLLTAEEFACLPEPREGGKMELVSGEVRKMAPVGHEHGIVQLGLGARLLAFIARHDLGTAGTEIGYRLRTDPDLLLAPDISFLARSRGPAPGRERSFIDGPPTLAVEVLSPNDRADEVQEKIDAYLAAGCQRVWIVEPRTKTVAVHRPGGDAHTYHHLENLSSDDAGFAVEGFALPVADIFVP